MKKILFIHLVIIISVLNAFSQSSADSLQPGPTCFMIARAALKATSKNVSEIYCIGEKIKVVRWDNRLIKGTLVNLSLDSMLTVDGTDIDFNAIRSITKTKTGTRAHIVGGLIITAGVATLATYPLVDFDSDGVPAQLFVGLGLVAVGVAALFSDPKFKVESGDQMIFKD